MRLKAKIKEIADSIGISRDTLYIIESCVDDIMPRIKSSGLDATQGALMVISHTITYGANNGALESVKDNSPQIYEDLRQLWLLCGHLCLEDTNYYGKAIIVGDKNPFGD
jgi:hypothetical protein